ncbi:hypothetical protein QQ045_000536 [Rhodiola kirilowii]
MLPSQNHVIGMRRHTDGRAPQPEPVATWPTRLPSDTVSAPSENESIQNRQTSETAFPPSSSPRHQLVFRFKTPFKAGKRVLIISVLQAIVFYWARICILPKKVLQGINSICANFLWNGKAEGRGCNLISWNAVCLDKREGGLGIKNLEVMNEALVLNQLWDLTRNSQNIWSCWVSEYWTKGIHCSWVLRRLSFCKNLSSKCTEVVDGELRWTGEGKGFTDICGKVLRFLGVSSVPFHWHVLIPWFKNLNQGRIRTRLIAAAITGSMYEIWRARNSIIFREDSINLELISRSIIWNLRTKIGGIIGSVNRLQEELVGQHRHDLVLSFAWFW